MLRIIRQRQAEEQASRAWDAVARGETPAASDLDATLIETIRRLQELGDQPHPDSTFADHLEDELMRTMDIAPFAPLPTTRKLTTVPNGQPIRHLLPGASRRLDPFRSRQVLAQLATAALVVLVLASSFFAIGSHPLGQEEDAPVVIPAIVGTPAIETGITTETLLQGSVSALPAGPVQLWATALVMQPGAETNPNNAVETTFFAVEQGTVHIELSDVERTLHAGETWSGPTRAGFVLRNIGTDEARVFDLEIVDAAASPATSNSNGNFSDPLSGTWDILIEDAATLPGGPGQVTLEQVTLPPDTALPTYADEGLHWLRISGGRLGVTLEGELLPFRWESGTERTLEVAQHLPVIPPGTRVTLRNAGEAPLILYRLTIEPGGAADATPAGTS